MGILAFMVLLIVVAVVCLRISSNMEGRGTFIFWAGILLIIVALLIGINQLRPIREAQDNRPYSTILDPNYKS